VSQAKARGIKLLPILGNQAKPDTKPAIEHLDQWREYVRRTVEHFQDDLKIWEVVNEHNASTEWCNSPNGTDYARFLKETYETIKAVNPELKVMYGGTSGLSRDFVFPYIEASLKAGAADYCDIIAVHPYNWPGMPEAMIDQIQGLREMLAKYGAPDKEVWLNELGYSTCDCSRRYRQILPEAARYLGMSPKDTAVALINDDDYGYFYEGNFEWKKVLESFDGKRHFTLSEIDIIDVEKFPLLIPAVGEGFPAEYIPSLIRYMNRGGTLVLLAGLPFYFDLVHNERGELKRIQIDKKFMAQFHIGWETFWTRKDVPPGEEWQKPGTAFQDAFAITESDATGRFLTEANLKDGDEMIPLIMAGTKDYSAPVAAIYKMNSDLKGNIIVMTQMYPYQSVTEEVQAQVWPRSYLIGLGTGMEKTFLFCVRDSGDNPEDRPQLYGFTRFYGLVPKPSYVAHKTMNRMLPDGSTRPEITCTEKGVYLAHWLRPCGDDVWAIWTTTPRKSVHIAYEGEIAECIDYMGIPVTPPSESLTASGSILYLVGPIAVSLNH